MMKYILCAGLGGAAGYLIAKNRLENVYAELLRMNSEEAQIFARKKFERKLAEVEARYEGLLHEQRAGDIPGGMSDFAEDALRSYQGTNITVVLEEAEAKQPHEITAEDFKNGDAGYDQSSLTYYAGDDVLAGQSDQKINETSRKHALGEEILGRLKEGLDDTNLIYVRSPGLEMDFEVLWVEGEYSVEVGEKTG